MRRYFHVIFVSFRIGIYSCFTNEKSGQMVKGVGEKWEEQGLAKEVEQEGPKRLVENLELQEAKDSTTRSKCSTALHAAGFSPITSGKNPQVSATWRSTLEWAVGSGSRWGVRWRANAEETKPWVQAASLTVTGRSRMVAEKQRNRCF